MVEVSMMADSDIELNLIVIQVGQLIQASNLISLTQFIFMMYNGLECLEKTNKLTNII